MRKSWNEAAFIVIPDWLLSKERELTQRSYASDLEKISLALNLAETNTQSSAGGPLAAAIFDEHGELISVGVDAPGIGCWGAMEQGTHLRRSGSIIQ